MFPGENEVEQLACIMELLGTPPDELINQATRRRLFFGMFQVFTHHSLCLYLFNQLIKSKLFIEF